MLEAKPCVERQTPRTAGSRHGKLGAHSKVRRWWGGVGCWVGVDSRGQEVVKSIKGSVPASPRGVSIDKMTGCYWSSAPDLRRVPPEGAFMGITTRANTNILAFPRKKNGNGVRVEDLRKTRARFYNQ